MSGQQAEQDVKEVKPPAGSDNGGDNGGKDKPKEEQAKEASSSAFADEFHTEMDKGRSGKDNQTKDVTETPSNDGDSDISETPVQKEARQLQELSASKNRDGLTDAQRQDLEKSLIEGGVIPDVVFDADPNSIGDKAIALTTKAGGDGPEAGGDQPGMVPEGSKSFFTRASDWTADAVTKVTDTLSDVGDSMLDFVSDPWDTAGDWYDSASSWFDFGGDPAKDISSASDLVNANQEAGDQFLEANKDKLQEFKGKEGKEFVENKLEGMDIPSRHGGDGNQLKQVRDVLENGLQGDNIQEKVGPNGDKIQVDPDTGFERVQSADGKSTMVRMSDGTMVTSQKNDKGEVTSEQWTFKNDDGTYSVLQHEGKGRWSGVVDGMTVSSDNGARVEQDMSNRFDIDKHGQSAGVGETEDKWYNADGKGTVFSVDKESGQADVFVNGEKYSISSDGKGLIDKDGKPANDVPVEYNSETGEMRVNGMTISGDHRRSRAIGEDGSVHTVSADANADGTHIQSVGISPDANNGPNAEKDDPDLPTFEKDRDRNGKAATLSDHDDGDGHHGIRHSDGSTFERDSKTGDLVWKDKDGNTIHTFNIKDGSGHTDGFTFNPDGSVTMDKNGIKIDGKGNIFDFDGAAIYGASDSLWYGNGWGTSAYDLSYNGMTQEQAQSQAEGEVNAARSVAMPSFLSAINVGKTGGDISGLIGSIAGGIGQVEGAKAMCLAIGAFDQIGALDSMLATGIAAFNQSARVAAMESNAGIYLADGGVGRGMQMNDLRAKLASGGTFTISIVDEMKNWDQGNQQIC